MNRFNLTFSGEIQHGEKPDAVKARFAKKFAIDDPDRLERFFSGQQIVLRRNLDRKEAAECFQEMRQIGVVAELVKVSAEEAAAAVAGTVNEESVKPEPKKGKARTRRKKSAKGESTAPATEKDTSPPPKPAPKKKRAKKKTADKDKTNDELQAATLQQHKEQLEQERKAREEAEAARQAAVREAEQLRADAEKALKEREAEEASRLAEERAAREEAERRIDALQSEHVSARKAQDDDEASQLTAEREARQLAERERQQAQEEKQLAEAALRETEEAAQRALEEERARRKTEAEEAAQRALDEERERRKAEEAAAEAAAREREAAARKAEAAAREAAALEKARAEKAERIKEEEAQRRAKAEAERQQAEEARAAAAREAEERELARRRAEEEAARRAEQEAEARRQAEATRNLAEKERQRAEEEQRRAEQLARENAALESERRAAAERAASLEAALKESTEQAKLEAEQQKVRAEKRLTREKERMAKEEARHARASAAREARLEKERREAEEKAAKREAALAEKARLAEARLKETQEAERKAREAAKRAQADAREQLLLEEQARAMEEQAVDRAASALSGGIGMGPARASTRTSLEVPQRHGSNAQQPARKRQPGEPNFYSLKPFRNTNAVRERATRAGNAARRLASMGAMAIAALAALTGAFLNYTPPPPVGNIAAVAVTPAGGPVLLAGDTLFLHDRSGADEAQLALADLGIAHLYPPLSFDAQGSMLAVGEKDAGTARQLLRCDLTGGGCSALPDLPADVEVIAYAENGVNGELFLLDAQGGALLKTRASGEVLARTELDLPEQPALRLHSGLLLLNSSEGPGLSVLRYDNDAFGRQLDEILLVPPPAAAAGHSRVGDFLFSGGSWWVTLYNPDNRSAGLYRFDSQWNYLDEAPLGHPSLPLAITSWGDKTLVNDGRGIALARFNSGGGVEVPLTSKPLEQLADDSRLRSRLLDSAWRVGLLALALAAVLTLGAAYLQRLRHVVYRSSKERGADPVDDLLDRVEWIQQAEGRERALRTRLASYSGIAIALVLIAVGQRVGAVELAALLLFLLGPGIALALVARSSAGHVGVADDQLLLVEPSGTYHIGRGASLLYRGNLVFIDDVALYTGSRLLPAFSEHEISHRVEPLVESGVRIDARTTLTRLLQSQHPLARGLAVITACTLGALVLLVAGGMF